MDQLTIYLVIAALIIIGIIILKHIIKIILIIGLVILSFYFLTSHFNIHPSFHQNNLDFVRLPVGFKIETFADNLGGSSLSLPGANNGPRMMLAYGDNVLVSLPSSGKVVALDGKNKKTFLEGLNKPHGLASYQDWIYIAEEDKVIRVKDNNHDQIADPGTEENLLTLPSGGHWTRTIHIFDNKLYITLGSTCNVCREDEPQRATMQACDLDGKNCESYATGLRNSVDFTSYQGKIYATDNGRDNLGNDIPPEEINLIEEGKDYGWPLCYGNNIHDTDFDKNTYIRDPCQDKTPPFVEMQAHSAPLGITVYQGHSFPSQYQRKIFVAFHGSWNRNPPTGYKIVMIDPETKKVEDFATGWLEGTTVKGRPVGIINFQNSLLVSDDNAGKIYKISYA